MWKWILLLLLAGPIQADSWHEVARRTHQQDLIVAASRYESVCNSPYEDVVQTRRAYERLQTAFDRMWPGALNNSASMCPGPARALLQSHRALLIS